MSLDACPDDPHSTQVMDFDCASGSSVSFHGVFETNVDVPDLVGLDTRLELALDNATFDASPFWTLDPNTACGQDPDTHASRFTIDPIRPTQGCADYRDVWNGAEAGAAFALVPLNPGTMRIAMTCYRTSPTSVTAGEKLFGFGVTIDAANATEAGGVCSGCPTVARIAWMSAEIVTWSGSSSDSYGVCTLPPTYCTPKPPLSTIQLNGTAVPALPRSWGRLKALYR
jgi:hypothetical protein